MCVRARGRSACACVCVCTNERCRCVRVRACVRVYWWYVHLQVCVCVQARARDLGHQAQGSSSRMQRPRSEAPNLGQATRGSHHRDRSVRFKIEATEFLQFILLAQQHVGLDFPNLHMPNGRDLLIFGPGFRVRAPARTCARQYAKRSKPARSPCLWFAACVYVRVRVCALARARARSRVLTRASSLGCEGPRFIFTCGSML